MPGTKTRGNVITAALDGNVAAVSTGMSRK